MIMQNPKNMSEMIYCTVKPLPWRRKPNLRSCNIAFAYNWSVESTHSNVDIVLKLYSKDLVFLDVGSIACSCQSLYCCWLLDFWCSMLDPDLNSSRWCMDIYDVIFFLRGGIRNFTWKSILAVPLILPVFENIVGLRLMLDLLTWKTQEICGRLLRLEMKYEQ